MKKTPSNIALIGGGLLLVAIAAPSLLPRPLPDFVSGMLYGMGGAALLWAAVLAAFGSRLPDPCDSSTPALRRRYLREFIPPMVAYVVATLLSVWWLRSIDATWLRTIVALLPVPAVALAMRAIMRYIRDADELQRRIELEAVSFATALVSLVYLAAGFLQTAKVIDIPSSVAMIWVFPLICLSYGLAKLAIARRFA
jgi:uncharacterized membrane protein